MQVRFTTRHVLALMAVAALALVAHLELRKWFAHAPDTAAVPITLLPPHAERPSSLADVKEALRDAAEQAARAKPESP